MPRKQTDLFTALTDKQGKEVRLNPDGVRDQLKSGAINYEQMSDLLRETNDAQYGIVSTFQPETNTWLRDATNATPLAERIPRDAPVIEANNALLRCLSRLRPIDYAIGKQMDAAGDPIRAVLKDKFSELANEILTIAQGKGTDEDKQKAIAKKEKEFNTVLVEKLHEANLTKGCESEEDAEKLLFHYRNLSSVLSPARTMVTLTYDATAKMLQRETQYPVTRKTPEQRKELEKLQEIVPHAPKAERNSHTAQKVAMQQADSLFADLIVRDDTALGAQARKTHLIGAKNAFIVKNELMHVLSEELPEPEALDALRADPADTLWLARMGSPAFVGKGEASDVVKKHSVANLEQVRLTAEQHTTYRGALHVTTLNTDMKHEHQDVIVDNVRHATKLNGDGFSNVATNVPGTFTKVEVDESLKFDGEPAPEGRHPFQKESRIAAACKVVLAAARNVMNTLSVVHCASGQDRTGTVVEKATQDWMEKRYAVKGLDASNIKNVRAEGGNAAEITTHHIHGSPGMKTDSQAHVFGEEVEKQMYLKSADTNKKNKVGNVSFLSTPNAIALTEFDAALKAFQENLKADHPTKQNLVYEKGNALLSKIQDMVGGLLSV